MQNYKKNSTQANMYFATSRKVEITPAGPVAIGKVLRSNFLFISSARAARI